MTSSPVLLDNEHLRPSRAGPAPRPRSFVKQVSDNTFLSHGHQPPPKQLSRKNSREFRSKSPPSGGLPPRSPPNPYQEDRERMENIEKKLDSIMSYLAAQSTRSTSMVSGGSAAAPELVPWPTMSSLPETPRAGAGGSGVNDNMASPNHRTVVPVPSNPMDDDDDNNDDGMSGGEGALLSPPQNENMYNDDEYEDSEEDEYEPDDLEPIERCFYFIFKMTTYNND
jgi:hypothetical protein